MRSSSTTTAAPSRGSAPVQSIRKALVKTIRLMRRSSRRYRATTFASYIHTFSSGRGDHSTVLATP